MTGEKQLIVVKFSYIILNIPYY